ncbi:MAG: Icc-related predicted phosphoesterase [Cellvibrionaceae bacterium]|jgi:Icc-related predicted phosphoesterase
MKLKLVLISDTHGLHDRLDVPAGDILLFAGDMADHGTLEEVADFNRFLGELPHKHKIIICGNHDFAFERQPAEAQALITNATYLQDEAVTVEGVKIYGSPWQPWFHDWAFNLQRGAEIREKWDLIPADTDILITHGPPMGIGDKTFMGSKVGCEELTKVVKLIQPKIHLFGHIHEAAGQWQIGETLYVNASMAPSPVSLQRNKVNRPIEIEIETETKNIEDKQ